MKFILFSILTVGLVGFIIPSAFADVYVHESKYPFSIQHPPGWIVYPEDEWGGVNIDADETGLNGFYVNLWCSESRGDDCGVAGADYQEMKNLKDDEQWVCNDLSMEIDHMTCKNLRIIDEKIHQIDGYRAFTITVSVSLTSDGNDPYYPQIEAGTYKTVGTTTYVLVENDIWVIASGTSPPQNFDAELDQKILSTFKINNIYAQEDVFSPISSTSWITELINSIMSIFDWGYDEPLIQNSVIREPEHTEYVPEQEYQWDNPIIMDLEF
tara:strand:- start:718 stop:1524 length:807 start_codon:yes stop_codon:yes gene_type:complete